MPKSGSGKSTLVRFIIEALDIPPDEVRYVSLTGKASEVLRKKGNSNAITAHKLLYQARQKKMEHIFLNHEKRWRAYLKLLLSMRLVCCLKICGIYFVTIRYIFLL